MKYVVLVFLCLITVIAYVQRLGIQSASEPLQSELRLNTEEFGALGSAWLIGYAVMQVPSGFLADRWGSRNALALYAAIWSSLTALAGLVPDKWSLLALWTLMGMALAGIFPCAAKAIGQWFPDTQKAMASGLLGSCMGFGTAAASFLTSRFLFQWHWTWQATFALYGLVGIVWAGLFAVFIPGGASHRRAGAPAMTRADWRRLATSPSMLLLCGQQFFRAGAMIFFINWFPKFLRESRQLSELQAGNYTFWANLGAMAGGLSGGFFSDWLLRRTGRRRLSRQGIAIAGLSLGGILVAATYFVTDPEIAIGLFTVGAFCATFGGVSGYTVTIEFGGRRTATVFSVMNMAGNFGAALFAYLAGALVQQTGNWDFALGMFIAIFGIDAACWALLNPKRPLFDEEEETMQMEPGSEE